jgi:hypothetical protein
MAPSVLENRVNQAADYARTGHLGQASLGSDTGSVRGRNLTDDEILGLGIRTRVRRGDDPPEEWPDAEETTLQDRTSNTNQRGQRVATDAREETDSRMSDVQTNSDELKELLSANPELERAWRDAEAFRESFATPEEARAATELVTRINAMDDLFFSRRPQDHAELARIVAKLDPDAFASLAAAMGKIAGESPQNQTNRRSANTALAVDEQTPVGEISAAQTARASTNDSSRLASVHEEFLRGTNAEAVSGVVAAIKSQVDRLLPERISDSARNRAVGEIYRELDASLQSNGQFARQVRGALTSGNFDTNHRNAIVSLVVGRARQALPSVAKRVLSEWQSTIFASNQERHAKQKSAENRVDIAGSRGGTGEARRVRSPRDIDYGRMSDSDILNL